jgi:N-6 DNA Methylase
VNEWTLAAEIKSWWDGAFTAHPGWYLDRCEVERKVDGTQQRSDLSVLGRGVVQLAGELRLPDHPVASPWHPQNLSGALDKAVKYGTRWCFTSDGTMLLLVDAERLGPPQARVVQSFDLVDFTSRDELDAPALFARTRAAWTHVIERLAPVVVGQIEPSGLPTDEAFISSLRALLAIPVAAIRDDLDRARLSDILFEQALVTWMVEEQGWTHVPAEWDSEIRRTAQLAAYVFVTRLMFYQALRQAHPTLSPLGLTPGVTAPVARASLEAYFSEARRLSGDYETVFAKDRATEYALHADAAIPGWRRVMDHLAAFDLTNVGYDVTGKLFERLIDPHERYRWGQHYTQPDVVDLMMSLAIPDGSGKVLDPATGGGTFLVRAYERKRQLRPELTHQELLSELYGLEVSAFAANLATVNLAVRDLRFEHNYPRIALRSFFLVRPHEPLLRLPEGPDGQLVDVEVGRVRAVVCNPPYVRLHALGQDRIREAESVLSNPAGSFPVPSQLAGAANYHLYFWFHAAQFLEEHGRLVLITSGEWLDSDYGAVLQEWLLRNFTIGLVVESLAEPWFSDARVGTVVLAATRCDDERERSANIVRFVTLRRPLRELYGESPSERDHLERVDKLRDTLLSVPNASGETVDYDWSAISQAELMQLGLRAEHGPVS